MSLILKQALRFKKKYPSTVAWRIHEHVKIVEKHINPGETPIYSFVGQKNDSLIDMIETCCVTLTNQRILIGRKRLLFGYFLDSITPDMFNDLKISSGMLWGKVYIDTVKEMTTISNLDIDSLPEIETEISKYMMKAKKEYTNNISK